MSALRKIKRSQRLQVKGDLQKALGALDGLTDIRQGVAGLEGLRQELQNLMPMLKNFSVELQIQRLTNLLMAQAILNCTEDDAQEIENRCRAAAEQRLNEGL